MSEISIPLYFFRPHKALKLFLCTPLQPHRHICMVALMTRVFSFLGHHHASRLGPFPTSVTSSAQSNPVLLRGALQRGDQ